MILQECSRAICDSFFRRFRESLLVKDEHTVAHLGPSVRICISICISISICIVLDVLHSPFLPLVLQLLLHFICRAILFPGRKVQRLHLGDEMLQRISVTKETSQSSCQPAGAHPSISRHLRRRIVHLFIDFPFVPSLQGHQN